MAPGEGGTLRDLEGSQHGERGAAREKASAREEGSIVLNAHDGKTRYAFWSVFSPDFYIETNEIGIPVVFGWIDTTNQWFQ